MQHLNGHLLCAIDCETTGLIAGFHDIIQICFLPLDSRCDPSTEYLPFDLKLIPRRKENIDPKALRINRSHISDILLSGVDPDIGADLFDDWFDSLKLPEGKRIMPLAHNWPFDSAFIIDWMGWLNFNFRIDGRFRDTMAIASYYNDVADIYNEQYPYPKVTLRYIASQMEILVDESRTHDAIYDCVLTAEIYKKLLRQKIGF